MLDYKNLQKLIIYLKKCINIKWNTVTIKNVEYQNLFDYDEDEQDEKYNIIEELIINDNEMYSDYEDIIILECLSKIKGHNVKAIFRIKILISNDNFLIYISYVPGNARELHNILSQLGYQWESVVPGYLLYDHAKSNNNTVNLEEKDEQYQYVLNSLKNTIKDISVKIN